MPSLSRKLAAWVAGLQFSDLPPAVVDRAKGVTLHGLGSSLLGAGMPAGKRALQLMQEEDAGGNGVATVLVSGVKLTRGSAAFVNSEYIYAGGKWDTYRMLTHPGCNILPTGLAAAELAGATGQQYLTGIVAGYEVMERMASDFIPTTMSRGFHAGPVFGIFGAAVAAAKILGLNEEQIHGTIAQCANLAAGNLEGARSGGQSLREGGAVRNAFLAVGLAKQGMRGGETVLEGKAGFYHSYTGNNQGALTYAFAGPLQTDLDRIAEDLGTRWEFTDTIYRIYSTAGFNIAHVDVTAALATENNIQAADIDRIESTVNALETQYPSPAFPGRDMSVAVGSTHYFSAYGAAMRGFPLLAEGNNMPEPPEVIDLMHRVTLVPSATQTLFGPTVTIHTKDGKSFTKEGTGREFMWDFEEEARRIRGIIPGVPMHPSQFEALVTACRTLDALPKADEVIRLTIPAK